MDIYSVRLPLQMLIELKLFEFDQKKKKIQDEPIRSQLAGP